MLRKYAKAAQAGTVDFKLTSIELIRHEFPGGSLALMLPNLVASQTNLQCSTQVLRLLLMIFQICFFWSFPDFFATAKSFPGTRGFSSVLD